MYKLRIISCSQKYKVQGITIPEEIAVLFQNTFFNVIKSGNSIIMTSGCNIQPTRQEIKDYQYEDCIIGSIL
jgi:hypothetical protein